MSAVPENIKLLLESYIGKINQLVYKFYYLTENEIKIVEGE